MAILHSFEQFSTQIAGQYELFIIDQWGVLHNGAKPYPFAIQAIDEIHRHGGVIVILSNSGKLANYSHKLIGSMGFNMGAIRAVISSGQAARSWLENTLKANPQFGKKLVFWGFDYDYTAIDGMGLQVIDDINMADFIVAAGAMRANVAGYEHELQIAAKRGLPMLCTNPDMVSNMPDGTLKICPGAIAERYEQLGGRVYRFGKPAREVYELCHAHHPTAKRIIGIGDSLDHDIKGANDFGIDSLFITGGIHERDLGVLYNDSDIAKLAQQFHTAPPTHSARFFGS